MQRCRQRGTRREETRVNGFCVQALHQMHHCIKCTLHCGDTCPDPWRLLPKAHTLSAAARGCTLTSRCTKPRSCTACRHWSMQHARRVHSMAGMLFHSRCAMWSNRVLRTAAQDEGRQHTAGNASQSVPPRQAQPCGNMLPLQSPASAASNPPAMPTCMHAHATACAASPPLPSSSKGRGHGTRCPHIQRTLRTHASTRSQHMGSTISSSQQFPTHVPSSCMPTTMWQLLRAQLPGRCGPAVPADPAGCSSVRCGTAMKPARRADVTAA